MAAVARVVPASALDGDSGCAGAVRGRRAGPRGVGAVTLVLGIGLRAGTSYRELRDLTDAALAGLDRADVSMVVTVDGKQAEPGLQRLVASLGARLFTATPDELAQQEVPSP